MSSAVMLGAFTNFLLFDSPPQAASQTLIFICARSREENHSGNYFKHAQVGPINEDRINR